jgi:hypothetical protein
LFFIYLTGRAGIVEKPVQQITKKPKIEFQEVKQFSNMMSDKLKEKKVVKQV